VEYGALLTMRS